MGLELMSLHTFHFFTDSHHAMDIHGVLRQSPFSQQIPECFCVQRTVDNLIQLGAGFRKISVSYCFNQQITEAPVIEGHLTENVEHFAAESVAFLFKLLEQTLIYSTFARFLGNQVPQMADFRLSDTMNTPEALLQTVRIPGQIVVDHQVRTLQVDTFTGSIRGNQNPNVLVLLE